MGYGKLKKTDPLVRERVEWWQRLGMDSVAHLTFDQARHRAPSSYRSTEIVVTDFLMKQGVKGPVAGVIEPHADGRLHCHVAYIGGETSHGDLRDAWFHACGLSEIHGAGKHTCRECTRSNCHDKRVGGGCHDLEYIAQKMTGDGRYGDRYIERTLS